MSTLHALLVGIDGYALDHLPNGAPYPHLRGAAGDVERMESLLRERAGLTTERTRKLLSRVGPNGRPSGSPEQLPTYANLVAALKQLAVDASPGDRVYIHYSGHGARLKTEYEEIKGSVGQDEALVPCDLGEPGSRYLRDVELAVLVRLLVDRGLLVTLVLDCCHAGGALRSGAQGAIARQVPEVHLTPVPSTVAPRDLLMRAWKGLQQEVVTRRNLSARSWLPVTRYSFFAACGPEERAYEDVFEGGEPQGVLTYWLLDTLKRSGLEQRCGTIHKSLVARISGTPKKQTPLFAGDGERPFLGEAATRQMRLSSPEGPMVLRLTDDGRIVLGWGQALGVRGKSRLLLKMPHSRQQTVLEVNEIGSAESLAEVVLGPRPSAIPRGSSVEVVPLQAVIRLLPPEPKNPAAEQALTELRKALWSYRGGFVDIDDEAGAPDLCVAFTRGSYEIRDPGGSNFPHLEPLQAGRGAVREVVRQLDQLARFRSLWTLENPEPPHWLEIGLELCSDDPSIAPRPFPRGGLDLKCNEGVVLRIINRSSVCLDFAVLCLAPDYSVVQLSPARGFLPPPLDPGEDRVLRVRGWLPENLREGVDLLKVFATRKCVGFRWLELPPLGRPDSGRTLRGGWTHSKFPEEEWISTQVEIRVWR